MQTETALSPMRTTDKYAVFGITESGKTTLVKRLIAGFPRFVIFDTVGDLKDLPGVVVFRDWKTVNWNAPRLVFDAEIKQDEETLEKIAELVYFKAYNHVFVLDEAHNYASAGYCPPNLQRLITRGRHHGNGVVLASQRPQALNMNARAQVKHFFSFMLSEFDREYVTGNISRAFGEAVGGLEKYGFVYHSPPNFVQKYAPLRL